MPEGSDENLEQVYAWANRRYFGGSLPDPSRIVFDNTLGKSLGITLFNNTEQLEYPYLRPEIRLSGITRHHPALFIDTLIEEMIRVWQQDRYHLTNDHAYLDASPGQPAERKGDVFMAMADQINDSHPEILVVGNLDLDSYRPDLDCSHETSVLIVHCQHRNKARGITQIGLLVAETITAEQVMDIADQIEVITTNTAAYRLIPLDESCKPNTDDLSGIMESSVNREAIDIVLENALAIRTFDVVRRQAPTSIRPDGMLLL